MNISVSIFWIILLFGFVNGVDILLRLKRERSTSSCPTGCECYIDGNDKKEVDCYRDKLTQVPGGIPKDATSVDLSYNEIDRISQSDFTELPNTQRLDLSYNNIKNIAKNAFKDMMTLSWLDLSFNQLNNQTFDEPAFKLQFLQVLNISNSFLNEIPQLYDRRGIYLTALEELYLGYNSITSIDPRKIPSSVKVLDLSCTLADELNSEMFSGLDKLERLILKGCNDQHARISSIKARTFEGLPMLTHLDLSSNNLRSIPQRLPNSLTYLDLSLNAISYLKRGACAKESQIISFYNSGKEISFDDSTRIGSEFSHLINLIELRINGNQIRSLCVDDFLNMDQLQILNLTDCLISTIHKETFVYPQSLRILDLSWNSLQVFEIENIADLRELYLQRNAISEFVGVETPNLPSLEVADFSFNPLNCDCRLTPFLEFLQFSYDVTFLYLSAHSNRYACSKPARLSQVPLMTLDSSDLSCDPDSDPYPLWAIIVPAIVGFLVVVTIVTCVTYKCGCCRRGSTESDTMKSDVSYQSRLDAGGESAVQEETMNDAAILCHVMNHKWVLNVMVPKLHRRTSEDEYRSLTSSEPTNRPLNVEVFIIDKTIKFDTLQECINSNRKIALVITLEFLQEQSCIYILKVIHERTEQENKEAVIVVLLDNIPYPKMPQPLQKLMVEKTYVQFPQGERSRQELYFWETLNSLVCSVPKNERGWGEESFAVSRQGRHLADRQKSETIRSTRRAKVDEEFRGPISANRAARLQRLGIKSNGEVADSVLDEVEEARNLARRKQASNQINSKPPLPARNPSTRATSKSLTIQESDGLQRDIDDIYSKRKDPVISHNQRTRVRSLLPVGSDDVDSIYSEDEEAAIPGFEVRPPDRSLPDPEPAGHQNPVFDPDDVTNQLHGTVPHGSLPRVGIEEEMQIEEKRIVKKPKTTLGRLKSFMFLD